MKLFGFAARVALVVMGLSVSGAAQGQAQKGTLMDIACSSHHATEAGYTESHDKKCLLRGSCVKSGYSLVTADKKVLKFDAKTETTDDAEANKLLGREYRKGFELSVV